MQIPDLNLLVTLNVLLEEGSVVGAARRMNLSAPAMSRTLTRIREVLNDPILVRSGRGLVPTPRALELREQVRGVVELAHGVFTQSQNSDLRELERTFSIRANDVFFGVYGAALRQQMALDMPKATLPVVLGSGWSGVLLHEAVGHGLEGDFNRKGSSALKASRCAPS